jgi:hypothetical protein
VTVRLADGRVVTRRRDIPIGAIGPDTRARHRALVREKYLAVGGSAEVADGMASLRDASPRRLAALLARELGPR